MKRFLQKVFARAVREHKQFGRMSYMGDRLSYWECRTVFPPTGDRAEVFVDGSGEDEDLKAQSAFYAEVCARWPMLAEVIFPALRERLRMRNPGEAGSGEFTLSSLSIPQSEFTSGEWNVSFETPLDPGHSYTVRMRGDAVEGVVLDG